MPQRPDGVGRFLGRSLAGFAVLLVIGLALAGMLMVGVDRIDSIDHLVASDLNAVVAAHPAVVRALTVVTAVGSTWVAVAVLSVLVAFLLIRRRLRLAAYVAVTAFGGGVLSPAIKELVGRLRPVVPQPVATAPGPSFPSGHTTTVTIMIGILLLVLLPAVPLRARRAVIVAGICVVLAVGMTRLMLGVHFVSDVVAGWLLGTGWVALTATAFGGWRLDSGLRAVPLARGLEPEAARDLVPAPEHEPVALPWIRATQLIATAVVLWAMLLGMGWWVTEAEPGRPQGAAEVAVVAWLAGHRTGVLDAVSARAADLGATIPVFVVGFVAAGAALAALRRWWPVLLLVVALVGELVLFLTTAMIIDRPRPPVTHLDAALPPTSSFPSGHTGAAICLYGGVTAIVFVSTRAWWRWFILAAAFGLVVTIAWARLYRGAHYPTDVLGSVALAVPWLLMCLRVLRPDDRSTRAGSPKSPRVLADTGAGG